MQRLKPLISTPMMCQFGGLVKSQLFRYHSTRTDKLSEKFETVFSFPFVKYFSLFNRIKVYQIGATSVAIPTSGLLEWNSLVAQDTFLSVAYVGITVGCLLSIASIPFTNIIGFLYISNDNTQIKISAVDFWGKRKDVIVAAKDWVPLMDIPSKVLDPIYLQPALADGTRYKLFVKFGKVHNAHKVSQVLE